MSIAPVQFAMVLGATGIARDAETPARPSPAAQPAAQPPAQAPAEPSGPSLSTDLRIDDQRRIYYAVINNRTGDVVLEIPPEQIRKLAEALDTTASAPAHSVDVKT